MTDADDEWAKAMAEEKAAAEEAAKNKAEAGAEEAEVQSQSQAQTEDQTASSTPLQTLLDDSLPLSAEEAQKLDNILDIPVTISMEVGRTSISIRKLLQLNQGSVVELDRLAGESLDVLVNGTLIAHGEVVVINDKFGIRLTDVVSQVERIKKLK